EDGRDECRGRSTRRPPAWDPKCCETQGETETRPRHPDEASETSQPGEEGAADGGERQREGARDQNLEGPDAVGVATREQHIEEWPGDGDEKKTSRDER